MILNDFQSFGDELGDAIRHSLTDVEASDDMSVVRGRVESLYGTSELRRRTRLFARMALVGFLNKIKYTAYEHADDVVGVRVMSSCSDATSDVVRNLAGCVGGDSATARFDSDTRVGAQLMAQASVEPHDGFTPLPDTPPFHFNDTAQYKPVFADE
jgi:ppGpp synthetase/RelA/SpoT-type nucleotidyltranferase